MKAVILNATILALFLYPLPQPGVAQTKPAVKQTTMTGCLQSTDEEDEYALTTDNGKEYRLFGSKTVNLAPHVGHKITVTGTPTKPRMQAGDQHQQDEGGELPHFNVSHIQMVSKSCK
jgi:hypothetical protein